MQLEQREKEIFAAMEVKDELRQLRQDFDKIVVGMRSLHIALEHSLEEAYKQNDRIELEIRLLRQKLDEVKK